MNFIIEKERKTNVCYKADICVIGGSCTGVFAAVRAARLGASVVLVEKQNCLGGVATSGLVNIWHSMLDADGKNQIIGGLTDETLERLKKADAFAKGENASNAYIFNPQELKIELDNYVKENKIKLYLHTFYSGVVYDNSKLSAVLIENKDGRSAIEAEFFIDASGDGDVARDLNVPSYVNENIQPPSACFLLQGNMNGVSVSEIVRQHRHEVGLEDDWGWSKFIPNCKEISLRADNHVFDVLCNKADDLTYSEIEGRRQMRALLTLLKKYGRKDTVYNLISTCSYIGIRDTVHFKTRFRANEMDLLCGKRYENAVLNGTYRVDIHHHGENKGITFKELNGDRLTIWGKNRARETGNWRKELGLTGESAKFYQVPFDILVCENFDNFIPVGRMLNADVASFGALRVMVNLNQLGEAAGVAAYLSVNSKVPTGRLDAKKIRKLLSDGGSIIL